MRVFHNLVEIFVSQFFFPMFLQGVGKDTLGLIQMFSRDMIPD